MGLAGSRPRHLSIIRAGQRAGQAIGIPSDVPVRATTSHQKTVRAISFGHAVGTQTEAKPQSATGLAIIEPSDQGASLS